AANAAPRNPCAASPDRDAACARPASHRPSASRLSTGAAPPPYFSSSASFRMIRRAFLLTVGLVGGFSPLVAASVPIASPDLTFAEVDGVVAVEAEHFIQQDLTLTRAFHIVSTVADPGVQP